MGKLKDVYDGFVPVKTDEAKRSNTGAIASLLLLPILTLAYAVYSAYTYSTVPKTITTSYPPVEINSTFSIPFTCKTSVGCIVQTQSNFGYVMTKVGSGETTEIKAYVYDVSAAVMVVWANRYKKFEAGTYQAQDSCPETATDAASSKSTVSLGRSYLNPYDLIPISDTNDALSNTNDGFTLTGSPIKNSQLIMVRQTFDRSETPKVVSKYYGSVKAPTKVKFVFSYDRTTPNQICVQTTDKAAKVYADAFGVSLTGSDYLSLNPDYFMVGVVGLAPTFIQTNITYYSTSEIVVTVAGSIGGVYGLLVTIFGILVPFIRDRLELRGDRRVANKSSDNLSESGGAVAVKSSKKAEED